MDNIEFSLLTSQGVGVAVGFIRGGGAGVFVGAGVLVGAAGARVAVGLGVGVLVGFGFKDLQQTSPEGQPFCPTFV